MHRLIIAAKLTSTGLNDAEDKLYILSAQVWYGMVWYDMVWYGIVEFNIPLDKV